MPWEGRSWISTARSSKSVPAARKFRFISYNVQADSKSAVSHHTATKSWLKRSQTLRDEIASYNADIICLQDVDHFKDFWRPQLTLYGYDSVYKGRTQAKSLFVEGVVIAYKSELFQLFKTNHIEFNDAVKDNRRGVAFVEKSITDDVGLVLFLQPWVTDFLPSALCVCSAMMSDRPGHEDVRMVQSEYLARKIERWNKEFQVPVLLGLSLHDHPASIAYSLLRTGRVPLAAQTPAKCTAPYATPTSRASLVLKWLPPKVSVADPAILGYKIAWRPGGNKVVNFDSFIELTIADCVKYIVVYDAENNKKVVAADELQYTMTGLCSGVPYEFRVVAINEVGQGYWSDISEPVVLTNPENARELPELVNLSDINEVQRIRKEEARASNKGLVTKKSTTVSNSVNSLTQLTPRDVDGIESEEVPRWRVLPASTNPRDGWKATLGGQHDQKILEDLNMDTVLHKSVLRTKHGFIREELRDFVDPLEVSPQKKEKIPARDDLVAENIEGEVDEFVEDPLSVKVVVKNVVHEAQPIGFTSEEELYDDAYDTILDCREVLDHIGVPNKRQVHDLQLRSAYETYGPAGEPIYTSSLPFQNEGGGVECEDYIFYSGETLQATKVLSIPLLCTLVGDTPLESICCNDLNSVAPFECVKTLFDLRLHKFYTTLSKGDEDDLGGDTRNRAGSVAKEADIDYLLMDSFRNASKPPARYKINEAKRLLKDALAKSNRVMNPIEGEVVAPTRGNPKDTFWGGRWTPFPTTNLRRNHRFLPNDSFCSSHIALVVEFSVESDLLVAQWKF